MPKNWAAGPPGERVAKYTAGAREEAAEDAAAGPRVAELSSEAAGEAEAVGVWESGRLPKIWAAGPPGEGAAENTTGGVGGREAEDSGLLQVRFR